MDPLLLGNDIIDLKFEEQDLHPRYIDRVFTAKEKSLITQHEENIALFWSAKEAAYKALKRINSGLVFSPKKFELDIETNSVAYESLRLKCTTDQNAEYVHTIC